MILKGSDDEVPLSTQRLLDYVHNLEEQADFLRPSSTTNSTQFAIVGSDIRHIESLDYESIENAFFSHDCRETKKYVYVKWAFCLAVGLISACVGWFITTAIENIAGIKFKFVSNLMNSNRYAAAFGSFAGANFVLLILSCIITAYAAPVAAWSGIPEVKAYLNGVDAPGIFSLGTLAVKIIGCIGAVSSSLFVGNEGPMVHTCACIASLLGQCGSRKHGLTCKWLRFFKNDRDRRDLVTCGSAAGVAAAFRAPVGGALFALMAVSSWWKGALLCRTLFTTTVVAVTLRALIGKGTPIMFDVTSDNILYHLADIPYVILLGVVGGLLGSLYNFLLIKVMKMYKRVNGKGIGYKLLLAACVSIVTSCLIFGLPWLAPCTPCSYDRKFPCLSSSKGKVDSLMKFQCPPGQYNALASLVFNTSSNAIRVLFSSGTNHLLHWYPVFLFFITSCVLCIGGYGIATPGGLFVPIILTGATYGRLVGILLGSKSNLDHGLFAVLGAASLLGGTMRMIVSFVVIIVELTNNLLLLPLVMLVVLISKIVADCFTPNIYDTIMKMKGLPYLGYSVEPYMRRLTVGDLVIGPLQSFNGIEKVGNVVRVLRTTGHNGFPVMDASPTPSNSPVLFGIILRDHLLVLLKKKVFNQTGAAATRNFSDDDFAKRGSGKRICIEEIQLSDEEMEMYMDLHPFTNSSPYSVVKTMSLAKAFLLFRQLGLRHLLVVPSSPSESPVVGILTRHDFMSEHVLGMYPSLARSNQNGHILS